MQHRNLNTETWSRMAIDSLFDRGTLPDWQEFAQAVRADVGLAKETLFMCERHSEQGAAELARVLVEHFHPELCVSSYVRDPVQQSMELQND